VGVPRRVDQRDAMGSQDLSRFRGGLTSNQQEWRIAIRMNLVDKLPGSRCIRPPLGPDCNAGLSSSVTKGRVTGSLPLFRPLGDYGQTRNLSEDAECVDLEWAINFYGSRLFHNDCEYSIC
jgi:hypothetical protein